MSLYKKNLDSDIKGTTNLGAEPATDDELILYDTDGDINKAVTIANLASAVVNRKGSRFCHSYIDQ